MKCMINTACMHACICVFCKTIHSVNHSTLLLSAIHILGLLQTVKLVIFELTSEITLFCTEKKISIAIICLQCQINNFFYLNIFK